MPNKNNHSHQATSRTGESAGKNRWHKRTLARCSSWQSITLITFCLLTIACNTTATTPTRYALATAHPYATEAGEKILKEGGNAFDAAIAVAAVLAVVEPYSSGLGGGGFWLLHLAKSKKNIMLDAREQAPRAAHRDMYLDKNHDLIPRLSVDGPLAAAIPGVPAALAYLAEAHGRLPLSATLEPAIKAAREGFLADKKFILQSQRRLGAINQWPSSRDTFLRDGKPMKAGDLVRQPELATVLQRIASGGKNGFYQGEVADKLVEGVTAAGGIWQLQDLSDYKIALRDPVRFTYQGAEIISASLPSSGGLVMAQIFNILSHFDLESTTSAEKVHYLVEAMRLAYRDRAKHLGDPNFVHVPIEKLTSMEYARQLAETIDKKRTHVNDEVGQPFKQESMNTTHYSIIDAEGNRVAATLSINYSFGCGFTPPGTGVLLNNEMDDFVAKPGTPNLYGLVGGKANSIEPGKRMLSSMSPTFVEDGQRLAILGTPGGSRIITMVTLAILDFLEGADATTIVSNKRFHHQYLPDVIQLESQAFDSSLTQRLREMGHTLEPLKNDYGNMQIIIRDYKTDSFDAATDPRGIGTSKVQ